MRRTTVLLSVDFRPRVGKKVEIGSTAVGLDARVGESETFGIVSPAVERLDATLNTHHLTSGGLVPILIMEGGESVLPPPLPKGAS